MAGLVWTIVVAGGGGTRFGGPKQFAALAGRTVLDRSVTTALANSDGVVVVLPEDSLWELPQELRANVIRAIGGATRSASVRSGLAKVPENVEIVLVHDAARPLCSGTLFGAVIATVRDGADCAVPALPISDTIKRIDGNRVVETVSRENVVTVQTPQAFRAATLRSAHAGAPEGTDDAALIERIGGTVVIVAGETRNLKITMPDDLIVAYGLLNAQEGTQ